MKPIKVPAQSVRRDSYIFDLIALIHDWDKKTGRNKATYYYLLVFKILGNLGEDYKHYDFFTPYIERDADGNDMGFNYDNVPEMKKEDYMASFHLLAYVFKKALENTRISEDVLIYGVISSLTKEFRRDITAREKKIETFKRLYEKGTHRNLEGIGRHLKVLESEEYKFNLDNQLDIWMELVRKNKVFNFI